MQELTKSTPSIRAQRFDAKPLQVALLAASLCVGVPAGAAEHIVKMLNNGASGQMVFEPAFVKADVGDTVVFQPTEPGLHNTHATLTPEGAEGWTSEPDTEHRVTLTAEGVYLYICQPHVVFGMVGVIQAGEAVNKEAAAASVAETSAQIAMNPERFNEAFANVD